MSDDEMTYEIWDIPSATFISTHATNDEAWAIANELPGRKTVIGVRAGLDPKYTRWLVKKMGDEEWVKEIKSRSDEADAILRGLSETQKGKPE